MTSTIVPPVDLAPGMPSRVVTISATDVTEGGQSLEGQMVRFALSDTLDVSSGGDVIAKTQAEVVLDANGEGRIRLPVYDEDVKTWCGKDWAILVTATWGSQKAIRVPAGTSSIALSALPPVRPLRGREKQWAITGASVSVTEGASWDIDVSLSGGILDFDFTVPPGATAWWKGAAPLGASDNIYALSPGAYSVWAGDVALALGLPNNSQGIVEAFPYGSAGGVLRWTARTSPVQIWHSVQFSGGWTDWEQTDAGVADKWDHAASGLSASTVWDDLPDGMHSVWSGPVAEALGLPVTAQAAIEKVTWGASGGILRLTSRSLTPQMWVSARLSGGWSEWVRVDTGGMEVPKYRLPSASAGALKSAPLAMTTGYGGATTAGTGTVSVIQYLPASVSRLQLHVRNWNPRYTNADRTSAVLTNVRIGRHTSGGNGTNWTNFPDGATLYESGWITVPEALRGQEVVVQYTWTGADVTQTLGTAWVNGTRSDYPPLWVWLEVEVPASVPVVAAFGSSTAAGVGAARPMIDSWLAQWCRENGAVPAFWAHSGDSASSWTATANRKWELYGRNVAAPDALLYAMGSNDWSGGIDATELQARIEATVGELRARVTDAIFGTTITPRRTPPGNDQVRIDTNAWMAGSGLFRDVFDFAGAVALPDGTLDPAVDADGTHVNTAGHARLAAAIDRPIVGQSGVTYLGDGVYEIS